MGYQNSKVISGIYTYIHTYIYIFVCVCKGILEHKMQIPTLLFIKMLRTCLNDP